MTWFKENKFLAGLIGITVVLAGLLIFFGMSSGKKLEEVKQQIAAKESELKTNKSLDPFPTPEHAKAKKESLAEVIKKANEAREKLLAFRPKQMDNVPVKTFSENLTRTVAKVKDLFQGEDALPANFALGFERYQGSLPKENATGVLSYQLGALEHVFELMAESGVKEVINLHRQELPHEKGEEWPNAIGTKGRRGSAAKGGARPKPKRRVVSRRGKGPAPAKLPPPVDEKLPPVAHSMPIELTFKGSEKSLREFLTKLANSDQYFFETQIARVQNPSPIPSAGKAAAAEKPKNDFGDFNFEGDEPADDGPAPSEKVLEQVSGGDDLVIFVRANLLLFMDEQKFPELK